MVSVFHLCTAVIQTHYSTGLRFKYIKCKMQLGPNMPGVTNIALLIHQHVVRPVVMLVKIVFCLKECLVCAAFARPHPFFFLVFFLVFVMVAEGGSIHLRDILTGGTALVWDKGWGAAEYILSSCTVVRIWT